MVITTEIQVRGLHSSDFRCPCCGALVLDLETLAAVVEINARLYPGSPVKIESGYRCPVHNEKVGGSPDSMHLRGLAVDLKHPNLTPLELACFILVLEGRVLLNPQNGCVHYEPRGYANLLIRLSDGKYYQVANPNIARNLKYVSEKKNQ